MTYDDNPFRRALEGWTANLWVKGFWSDPDFPERQCVMRRVDTHLPTRVIRNGNGEIDRYMDILNRTATQMFPDRAGPTCLGGAPAGDRVAAAVNDHTDTTFDDIVALLEKCAIRWDEPV